MSTTTTKVPHAEALAAAEEFRNLFKDSAAYEQWSIAGSLRRMRPEVGDVEHVVVPRKSITWKATEGSLFGDGPKVKVEQNNLWVLLDMMVERGIAEKAVYGDTGHRWGEKYRGVVFKGVRHEIFCADADNIGAILTIRTGPAAFSKLCMGRLNHAGVYRQQDGYVVRVADNARITVPDEQMFLRLCGVPWVEAAERDAWAEARK